MRVIDDDDDDDDDDSRCGVQLGGCDFLLFFLGIVSSSFGGVFVIYGRLCVVVWCGVVFVVTCVVFTYSHLWTSGLNVVNQYLTVNERDVGI